MPITRKRPQHVCWPLLLGVALGCALGDPGLWGDAFFGVASGQGTTGTPLGLPTLGGKQFWSDQLLFHRWRIQENVLTGHCRLLDEQDYRRATGTFTDCRKAFETLRQELAIEPMANRVVIVLHGLGRSRQSMAGIVKYLGDHSDYTVLNVAYASTRARIGEHAKGLARVVDQLPANVTEVNFVAHSMGNLVIRHYLGDLLADRDPQHRDRINRLRRTVMLAPPNRGAMLAKRFQANPVFRVFWGISGREIANWETLAPRLAIPPIPFGIVAGGAGKAGGRNPLIKGDDDFVVGVAETQLAGARDFIVVLAPHAVIMDSAEAQAATLRFLEHGYFVSADKAQPIAPALKP
jgi:hypothetical protein